MIKIFNHILMEFAKRLVWYLFGVGFGVVFVMFIFGDRDITFNYFPNARVKGDLLKKVINYDKSTINTLEDLGLDTLDVNNLLKDGDVDFSKSNTDLDSCKTYYIENDRLNVVFENCESLVNLLEISITDNN